jgi:hypothetical protein
LQIERGVVVEQPDQGGQQPGHDFSEEGHLLKIGAPWFVA